MMKGLGRSLTVLLALGGLLLAAHAAEAPKGEAQAGPLTVTYYFLPG